MKNIETGLRTDSLVKIYRGRKVVDQVSVEVRQGEIVGLLGPNGAGKTTTFYMITGMIRPNAGNIFYNGKNVKNTQCIRERGWVLDILVRKLLCSEN